MLYRSMGPGDLQALSRAEAEEEEEMNPKKDWAIGDRVREILPK